MVCCPMHCCLLLVKEYKYLGPVFDDKLTFEANTDIIRGKALQCILRNLTTFRVFPCLLRNFVQLFYYICLKFFHYLLVWESECKTTGVS